MPQIEEQVINYKGCLHGDELSMTNFKHTHTHAHTYTHTHTHTHKHTAVCTSSAYCFRAAVTELPIAVEHPVVRAVLHTLQPAKECFFTCRAHRRHSNMLLSSVTGHRKFVGLESKDTIA